MTWPFVKPVSGYIILSRLESASFLPPAFTAVDATPVLYNFGERGASPDSKPLRSRPMGLYLIRVPSVQIVQIVPNVLNSLNSLNVLNAIHGGLLLDFTFCRGVPRCMNHSG